MRASQWLQALGLQLPWQHSLNDDRAGTRIAIIGAGIAASSLVTALSAANNGSLHITVFEREDAVGGRISSTPHPLGYHGALEHGAAYLTTDDTCVIELAHRAGIQHGAEARSVLHRSGAGGHLFRFGATPRVSCDLDTHDWRRMLDLTWQYGLSFWRARRLVQSISSSWRHYNATQSPLAGLSDPSLFKPAEEYFKQAGISEELIQDFIRPCTKARTYRHTGEQSALSSLLATTSVTRTGIIGGNQQIVQRSLTDPAVDVMLNTTVLRIGSGKTRAYSLRYISPEDLFEKHAEFDIVILTAPLSTTGIGLDLAEPLVQEAHTPYSARHVTYVATFQDISYSQDYSYLDIVVNNDNVLTSSQISDAAIDTIDTRTRYGKIQCHPGDELDCDQFEHEHIYRIVSRKELRDWDVVRLIQPTIGSQVALGKVVNITDALSDTGISLIRKRAWPYALPQLEADHQPPADVVLAPGLFYTAAYDPIVSSMEMSCRAGEHVAAQIIDMLTPK